MGCACREWLSDRNIPFYAKEVAYNDIVNAEPDEDGMLRFTGLFSASGHSTIRLWFANEADVAQVRDVFRGMGCSSELDLLRLVAVDIPPSVSYENIRTYLDQQESTGIFEYEEACFGQERRTYEQKQFFKEGGHKN